MPAYLDLNGWTHGQPLCKRTISGAVSFYFASFKTAIISWFHLDADIEHRQEQLLSDLIESHHQDIDFIEFLFEIIAYFPGEQRSRLIFTFLQHNKNFADFKRLDIEPVAMSWSGSAVPVYQELIDYLKSILHMLDSAQLLEHRAYVQQRIDTWEHRKNLEKKQDFMGEDDF